MIRHTVDEARENVAKVPINEVFNWRRLWRRFFAIIGIMVVMTLACFVGYMAIGKPHFVNSFGDVVTIYAERDLLLQQTPWPRRAYVEVIAFPEEGLRVGKDDAAPTIRVRAYRWVIADGDERFGWRPMRWSRPRLATSLGSRLKGGATHRIRHRNGSRLDAHQVSDKFRRSAR